MRSKALNSCHRTSMARCAGAHRSTCAARPGNDVSGSLSAVRIQAEAERAAASAATAASALSYSPSKDRKPATLSKVRTSSPAAAWTIRPPRSRTRLSPPRITFKPSLLMWVTAEKSSTRSRAPSSMAVASNSSNSAAVGLSISPLSRKRTTWPRLSEDMGITSSGLRRRKDCIPVASKVHTVKT